MFRSSGVALSLALALGTSLALPAPALADPPPWAGKWKHKDHHHRHYDHDDYRVVYVPQPRIVEHHVYHQRVPVARGLPYGFNRGTCDRGLISSELMGGVVGGAAGGLLGHQIGAGSGNTAATIGGAVLGTLVGGSVGRSMDPVDQGCVAGALSHVPDNRPIMWEGDRGEDYRVMPVRSYRTAGRYCREYQTTAVVGGRRQQTFGTACMQPDGQWEIVD